MGTRILSGLLSLCLLCAAAASSGQVLDVHPNQRWRIDIDRHAARLARDAIAGKAAHGTLGCERYCAQIEDVFARLLAVVGSQLPASVALTWHLVISRDPADDAWSLADGHVFISEHFIRRENLSRDEIAFVLAHEIAHVLNRDQTDTVELARALVPMGVNASVEDTYSLLDYDLGVLLTLAPLLRDMEAEADRTGLLIAALAGFPPDAAGRYLHKLAAQDRAAPMIPTHPSGLLRRQALEAQLAMARRVFARRELILAGSPGARPLVRPHSSSSSSALRRGTFAGSQTIGR